MHISVKYSSRLDLPTLKGNEGHRKTICLIGTECKVSNGFSLRERSSPNRKGFPLRGSRASHMGVTKSLINRRGSKAGRFRGTTDGCASRCGWLRTHGRARPRDAGRSASEGGRPLDGDGLSLGD
jgi:hypothetical protein